ncbi:MAG TPA: hypothetical protein VJ970_01330, partial [Flavobacteriaceae bacterium]|nr:hypothetical protein [Flavobacteriaceae bacterium]
IRDKYVWIISILSVVITYFLNAYSTQIFNGYVFGYELLIVNGLLTFIGLLLITNGKNNSQFSNTTQVKNS